MVQAIRSFSEGCRKGLGIVIRCNHCAKRVTYRCYDFDGYISPPAEIERLKWRCSWCRSLSTWVRYTLIDDLQREDLSQWKPPPWLKRRWPTGIEGLTKPSRDRNQGRNPSPFQIVSNAT